MIFDELTWETYKEYFGKYDESQFYLGFDRRSQVGRIDATECYLVVDSRNETFAIDMGHGLLSEEQSYRGLKRIYEKHTHESIGLSLSNDWFNQWKGLFDVIKNQERVDNIIIDQINYRIYNKLCERDSNIKTLFKTSKEFRESEFGFNLSPEAKEKVDEIMEYLISEAKK